MVELAVRRCTPATRTPPTQHHDSPKEVGGHFGALLAKRVPVEWRWIGFIRHQRVLFIRLSYEFGELEIRHERAGFQGESGAK